MKIIIQLDDWQLDELKDALKVTETHFKIIAMGQREGKDAALPYAYRIMRARRALDLSIAQEHVTQ